jgi:hypothetical protein
MDVASPPHLKYAYDKGAGRRGGFLGGKDRIRG